MAAKKSRDFQERIKDHNWAPLCDCAVKQQKSAGEYINQKVKISDLSKEVTSLKNMVHDQEFTINNKSKDLDCLSDTLNQCKANDNDLHEQVLAANKG